MSMVIIKCTKILQNTSKNKKNSITNQSILMIFDRYFKIFLFIFMVLQCVPMNGDGIWKHFKVFQWISKHLNDTWMQFKTSQMYFKYYDESEK
jgi:hypothetical protein